MNMTLLEGLPMKNGELMESSLIVVVQIYLHPSEEPF